MFVSNDIVSNNFRIEIQIFQQQQKLNNEKKKNTHCQNKGWKNEKQKS